ncbi:MAG TPA: sigma-54 dependent transcriptional regulator [bacterium]
MTRLRILVAEDEQITLDNLVETLRDEGHAVTGVRDGAEALAAVERGRYDLLITDIKMPKLGGLELLEKVRERSPETGVIVLTGFGSIGSAVEAMRKGAIDYLTKPYDLDELTLRVAKIGEDVALRRENAALRSSAGAGGQARVIARSAKMQEVLATVERLRDSDVNLLLLGETGVGKTLVARAVHQAGRRRDLPFLALNCATLTEELLASELFGHEKGAFTGAVAAKKGLVEIADTGTLFLDEIAELSPGLQAKLLKVVEEGEFYRVGGTRPLHVDVRFIAATNQNVRALIAEGRFREDLYYRLDVMEIVVPPLRERPEDIRPLCAFFLQKHLPKSRKRITGISEEALAVLKQYSFPGNVRELENIIERAIILEHGPVISPESLPQGIRVLRVGTVDPDRVRTVDEVVADYARQVVKIAGGNRTRAAEMLGISRTSLWKILKEDER